jgi:hypothetical protein
MMSSNIRNHVVARILFALVIYLAYAHNVIGVARNITGGAQAH